MILWKRLKQTLVCVKNPNRRISGFKCVTENSFAITMQLVENTFLFDYIDVGVGNLLGVQRTICPIFPTFARQTFMRQTFS